MRSGGAAINSDGFRPRFVWAKRATFWPLFNMLRLCFKLISTLVFETCLHFFGERVIMRANHMDEQHRRRTYRARAARTWLHAI